MEISVLGQVAQFLIQHTQTLARHFIGLNVVDTDLQILQTGFVETFNTVRSEIVTIRDQARDHSTHAYVVNDLIELRMHHRFATGNGDDRSSQIPEFVETTFDYVEIDWFRIMVVLVAITTRQITTPHRDEMGQHRMATGQ